MLVRAQGKKLEAMLFRAEVVFARGWGAGDCGKTAAAV